MDTYMYANPTRRQGPLIANSISSSLNDNIPAKEVTFQRDITPWQYPNRRVGRPKLKWAAESAKIYCESIWSSLDADFRTAQFNLRNETHRNIVIQRAHDTVDN